MAVQKERQRERMKKSLHGLMRIGAWLGGILASVLLIGVIALVLGVVQSDGASVSIWTLLPTGFQRFGFSLSTALAAVLFSFPLSWALSVVICYLTPRHWREGLRTAVSCLSSIPAVVFGAMSLNYFVPNISSAWWAVVVTLMLICLMRQTLALIRVNERHDPAVKAADALGAYFCEVIFQVLWPRAALGYLTVALRMLTRCVSEGVAILLVLSAYTSGADTLATALMKALGVTGDASSAQWVFVLAVLLLVQVLAGNALISACVQGGWHGKKNAK